MGSELSPLTPPKTPISQIERTREDTLDSDSPPIDPDLALIQERWPKLSEAERSSILAIVRAADMEKPQ